MAGLARSREAGGAGARRALCAAKARRRKERRAKMMAEVNTGEKVKTQRVVCRLLKQKPPCRADLRRAEAGSAAPGGESR